MLIGQVVQELVTSVLFSPVSLGSQFPSPHPSTTLSFPWCQEWANLAHCPSSQGQGCGALRPREPGRVGGEEFVLLFFPNMAVAGGVESFWKWQI